MNAVLAASPLDRPAPAASPPDRPTRADYRDAMARLPAAVHLVTTDGPAGQAGFTATAVCSVTDDPPTLLVCLNRAASAYPAFRDNEALCVNVLGAGQQALSDLFGGRTPMAERFAAARWTRHASGAPVLAEAATAFDCRIASRTPVGTHDVLVCEVLGIASGAASAGGLVYHGRRYRELPAG